MEYVDENVLEGNKVNQRSTFFTKTLLLVEDDESICRLISQYLATLGYRVVVAKTLVESLVQFYREEVDGVMLDMVLPDGSGKEFFESFRNRNIPIMVMSILSRERVSYILGTKDFKYLPKPFDIETFHKSLSRFL